MRSPGTTRRVPALRAQEKRPIDAHVTFFVKKQSDRQRNGRSRMVVVTRGKGGLGGRYTGVFYELPELHWTYIHAYQSRRSILASRVHAHADFHGIITPPLALEMSTLASPISEYREPARTTAPRGTAAERVSPL